MLRNIFRKLGAGIMFVGAGCVLPACAQLPAPDAAGAPEIPIFGAPLQPDAADVLPDVDLSGELLFQILAADFAAQNGAWAVAINTGLELARATHDPRLARRALEYALAGDNLPRAWDAARLWLQLSPDDPQAQQAELMLAAANGNTDNLAQALRRQIDAAANKGDAIVQAQQILSRLTDKAQALTLLDGVLAGDLRNLPEARAALAQSAYEAGDVQRAVAEARAALAARPDWELAAGMVLQFGLQAEPEATLASTRGFISRHPDARDLRLALVSALVQRSDFDAAMRELRAMARHSPEDFELLYLQGAVSFEAGRARDAEKWLREYIQVESRRRQASQDDYDPTSSLVDAQLLLARIAEEEGRFDQAYEILGSMDSPDARFVARMRQAVLRANQGRIDEAMKVLDSAGPEDERDQVLQALTRGQILRDAGRIDEAIRSLEASSAGLPDSTEVRYDLAMLYERQDRIAEMEQQLRRIIAIDPNHAHAYNALGYTLADRNLRLQEAERLIARALQLQPQDASILDSMGWVKYRLGDNTQAIEYLRRAWTARPDAEIGAHLGEVLWQDGQRDEALAIWRAALANDPDNALLQNTMRSLGITP